MSKLMRVHVKGDGWEREIDGVVGVTRVPLSDGQGELVALQPSGEAFQDGNGTSVTISEEEV